MAELTKITMTAQEYFDLPETTTPMQLIEGELIVSPAPTPYHGSVIINLIRLIDQLTNRNGQLFTAVVDVKLDDENVFEPDVFWIAPENKAIIQEKSIMGAPDLVVEVLSPSTARLDRSKKFTLYEQHGVREYWIVDLITRRIEVWTLTDSEYALHGSFAAGANFASPLLGKDGIDPAVVFA